MNEEMSGEQPENVKPLAEENAVEEDMQGSPETEEELQGVLGEAEKGSPLGKFKNVNDLYDAYNNLQAEFTRKSQRLSELEKEKTNKETDKFEEDFKSFLSRTTEACPYAEEIRSRLGEKKGGEANFDQVWATILYEKLSSVDRAKEPLVQNLILNDDQLQKMVIENYMKKLEKQSAPITISSNAGETVTKPVANKPDTFEDAKRIVLELLD